MGFRLGTQLNFDSCKSLADALTYVYFGKLSMLDERPVSLFRNGRNQAVRIPREFELQGTQALMRRDGESLVITPIKKSGLLAVLAQLRPMNEDFPEIEDLPLTPVNTL